MAIVQTGVAPHATDVLLIGFGRIGGINSENLCSSSEPETYIQVLMTSSENFTVSVADSDQTALVAASKYEWVSTFHSLDDALETGHTDIAIIATPDDTHFSIAMKLLGLDAPPKVIVIEKPVCATEEELDQLDKIAESKQIQVFVNHTRRFDVEHQKLATQIQSGQFGTPRRISAFYYGGWLHNGIHMVDVIQMLLGATLKIESAVMVGAADRIDVTGKSNQAVVSIESTDDLPYQFFEYTVFCDEAVIRFSDFGQEITIENSVSVRGETVLDTDSRVTLKALQSPIQNLLTAAVHVTAGGKRTSLVQVRQAMEPIWAAQKLSQELSN
jgi:predicted dehydrogenase